MRREKVNEKFVLEMEREFAYDLEDIEARFLEACSHVKAISSKLQVDRLLQFYGLYKQAIEGPCSKPKPNIFQIMERQKWQAWASLKDMEKKEAMMKYIECLNSFDENWKSTPAEKTGSWIHHSSMQKTEEEIEDCNKTLFDWVKEGNLIKIESSISDGIDVNLRDEHGLSLLHWAADRGVTEVVKYLVQHCKTDVNLRDGEGQTALHYASFCGHEDIVSFLLDSKADVNIQDDNGQSPFDIANNSNIQKIIQASCQKH